MNVSLFASACLALALAMAPVDASRAEPPPAAAGDREQLEALNARWLDAYQTRDAAALGEILSEDFVGLYGDRALSKADMLARLPSMGIEGIEWEALEVHVAGDTAVSTAISTVTSVREGTRSVARYRYVDVYRRQAGRWQAVASHVVRLDA